MPKRYIVILIKAMNILQTHYDLDRFSPGTLHCQSNKPAKWIMIRKVNGWIYSIAIENTSSPFNGSCSVTLKIAVIICPQAYYLIFDKPIKSIKDLCVDSKIIQASDKANFHYLQTSKQTL